MSSQSFSLTSPKLYHVPFSLSNVNNTLTFDTRGCNHHIINLIINNTPTPPTPISVLNIVLKLKNLEERSLVVINVSDGTITFDVNLTVKKGNDVIFEKSIELNDVINIHSGLSNSPLITHVKQSIENNLKDNFGLNGDNTASNENPIMTFLQVERDVPEILEHYLDSNVPIGMCQSANKILTTDDITDTLNDFVQPGYKLTKKGNNKLVTTYGNNNIIANFFGTLSANPGMIASTASGIINNNNLVTVNLLEGSTLSLIESISIPKEIFELYVDGEGGELQVFFTELTLSSTTILTLRQDFVAQPPVPPPSSSSSSVKVTGNLIGGLISTPTADVTYGLVSGSLFTSTYRPSEYLQTGHLTLEFTGSAQYKVSTNESINLPKGKIRLIDLGVTRGTNFSFPCNAYGAVSSFSVDNTTVPVSTEPPVIINAMLPLFNELAVASGLAYSNQIKNLTDLLSKLKLNIGNLKILTNYLQAHSENIHVVGKYTSTITINGNGLPRGYSYYNPSDTQVAGDWWKPEYYSPVYNDYIWAHKPSIDPPIYLNMASSDIVGTNSSDNLHFEEDVGITVDAILHPMLNTIVIPSSYMGYGDISYDKTNSCGSPFPTFMLSININNLITNIQYPTPSLPDTTTPYIDTFEFSNGTQIKSGTQIQILNESNYYVQFVSRNLTYNDESSESTVVDNISQLKDVVPVPSFPYEAFPYPSDAPPGNEPPNSSYGTWAPLSIPPYIANTNTTINAINLRDTTSDVIYIRPNDTLKLIYASDDSSEIGGVWKHI